MKIVKFTNSSLSFSLFYFHFILFSYFSIFRIARVRVRSDQSHCHISHKTWENKVEGSRINDSCSTHSHLG